MSFPRVQAFPPHRKPTLRERRLTRWFLYLRSQSIAPWSQVPQLGVRVRITGDRARLFADEGVVYDLGPWRRVRESMRAAVRASPAHDEARKRAWKIAGKVAIALVAGACAAATGGLLAGAAVLVPAALGAFAPKARQEIEAAMRHQADALPDDGEPQADCRADEDEDTADTSKLGPRGRMVFDELRRRRPDESAAECYEAAVAVAGAE